MSRLSVELAEPKDDAAIRRLLQEIPMPGPIRVAFTREPSIFAALDVAGRFNQIIVVRNADSGLIVGVGTRSIKTAYINGVVAPLGYLGNLRGLKEYRGGLALARGYHFLRQLHEDGRTALYVTTIAEDNAPAREILTSGRGGLPAYRDCGRFYAMAIDMGHKRKHPQGSLDLNPAEQTDLPEVIEFLRQEGPKKQFFPEYGTEDFQTESGLLRGLRIQDLLLCRSGGKLSGMCAAWNQSAFRQYMVAGYAPALAVLRPLYNGIARVFGSAVLPRPGSNLSHISLALVCVRDNNPDVFTALVAQTIERHRPRHAFMIAGLHERDPLLPILRRYRHRRYLSRVYVVHWQEGAARFQALDQRIPYLELASL